MSDSLLDQPARVRAPAVAKFTSLSVRKVLELAAAGKLPGAAKLGGVWTFDPTKVLAWIKQQERVACRSPVDISTSEVRRGGDVSVLPDESIAAAYERLILAKRRGGSRRGGSKSSVRK